MRASLRTGVLGVTIALLLAPVLGACTRGGPEGAPPGVRATSVGDPVGDLAWSEVHLRGGREPSLVAGGPGGAVLVATDGGAGGHPHPGVEVRRAGASIVRVDPATYYGARTVWHGFAVDGRRIYAFGGRSGGAHGNIRWTVWAGTVGGGLVEDPQDFETFGGPNAGGLSAVVAPEDGPPLLVGSRVAPGGAGLDVVLWDYHHRRWTIRSSRGTALAATDEQQPTAHAMVRRGRGLLIAGSVTSFDDGVRTRPAVWLSPSTHGPWELVLLPVDDDVLAEAQSADCRPGGRCLVVGYADGRLAAWTVSSTGDAASEALPVVAAGTRSAIAARDESTGSWAVAAEDPGSGAGRVLLRTDDGWRQLEGPPGEVTGFVVAGGSMWVSTTSPAGGATWTARTPRP